MAPDATTEKIWDKNKSRFNSRQAARSNPFMSKGGPSGGKSRHQIKKVGIIYDNKANSNARSKTKNPRSKIGRFRSGKIVFVPGTKTILCEIEKSAGFYLRG